MKKTDSDFQKLWEHSKKRTLLKGACNLLEWEQETYMPPKAAEVRSEQIEVLASLTHEMLISDTFINTLSKCIDLKTGEIKKNGFESWQNAALKQWRHDVNKATSLPNKFVQEFAKLCSQSVEVWKSAKRENKFDHLAPYLERIVAMNKEKAERYGYEDQPYDALLDEYEPNITTEKLNTLFPVIGREVSALLEKIKGAKQIDNSFLSQKVSAEKQLAFGNLLLEAIGYTKDFGRLDISAHPFSSSTHPFDTRLTSRISDSLFDFISATLHEGGHGLYEAGLNPKYFGTPVGESLGLGMHESQSRLYETRVGQCRSFWIHFLPLLKKAYGGKLKEVSSDEFYKGINKVIPSYIRVEADEVTYPLHVIVRFEIEKELINGSMKVRDIPDAWNFLMKTLLGISPKTDQEGCLQDIHWSMGSIGYFPTYLLGTIYSGQIFTAFEKQFKDWESRFANGEILFLTNWLKSNLHQFGRTYSTDELIEKITGKKPDSEPYLRYLRSKFSEIYSLKNDS